MEQGIDPLITRADVQDFFPELAESEDEKIRKELTKHLKELSDWKEDEVIPVKNPSYYRQWASWLEKQGEKLPAGFYYVNSEGKKFYSDTFKYGDVILHVEKQGEHKTEENKGNIGEISPKWSEEDEVKINRIVACLENLNVADNDILLKDIDWLKSLRPQNKWKPSEEQMSLLQAIINEPNNAASESCQIVLKDILEQLKKLKGEV